MGAGKERRRKIQEHESNPLQMSKQEWRIESVCIINTEGSKRFAVGADIKRIEMMALYFNGDPYDHYIGYNVDGEVVFSINCLIPCEVNYSPPNP